MARLFVNWRILALLGTAGGLLAFALWPTPVDVDVAAVSRGPLVVTVDEEGRTRVRDRFVVSAPVAGRVLRIELEPGDRVRRGDVVARVQAEVPPLLDVRTSAEARAAIDVARAELGRARAEEQRAAAAMTQAQRELERTRRLTAAGVLPMQELDVREVEARLAEKAWNAATFAARAASAGLERAEARLAPASPRARNGATVAVAAPVDGVILRRLRESESFVPAGEPLVEIGDPTRLEIVVDLLSMDATRIRERARATVQLQTGAEAPLDATVRRIEPSGFTKVSALGVEEQRVNVVLDVADQAGEDTVLGDAYRVEVRIVVWEAPDVLKVPMSALFRAGDQWAVYEVRDGLAQQTLVELGQQTGREAEVLAGLTEHARVIVHPGDAVRNGTRVKQRS
jgi:HlyD family secretion protein